MKSVIVLLTIFMSHTLMAQDVVNLWAGQPPYSRPNLLEETVIELWGVPCAKNVTNPTLTVYCAQGDNSGRAMIILPGGGYELESIVAEGRLIAEYLSSKGIVAAVLKYRLPLKEASEKPHPDLTFAGINRLLSYFDTMNMAEWITCHGFQKKLL